MSEDTETTPTPLSQAAAERREAKRSALEAAQAAITSLDARAETDVDGITADSYLAIDGLRNVLTVFGPRARASKGPRVQLEKAGFEEVRDYFVSTGLTRKELASAAKVSTSVIATVQNEKGDRWSTATFEAKRALIDEWMADPVHAAEIQTRKDADAAILAAKDARATAKIARATAAAAKPPAAKPAKAAATAKSTSAKSAAGKPGRPSPARRAQNKKASAPAQAVTA